MAPEGVSIHTTRLLYRADEVDDPVADMEQFLPHTLEELRGLEVDIVAYACTASALKTPHEETRDEVAKGAAARVRRWEQSSRLQGTRRHADCGRLSLSRGSQQGGAKVPKAKPTVTADEGIILFEAQQRLRHMNLVTEADVEKLAKHIDSPDAEAIFLSCGDMATLGIVDELKGHWETCSHERPPFWGALRAAGIDDRIDGFGTLLAMH